MGVKCDLAVDMAESNSEGKGFICDVVYGKYCVKREDITVTAEEDERRSGIKRGRYITLTRRNSEKLSESEKVYFISALAKAVCDMIDFTVKIQNPSVLVIGLGNGLMTADALGKKVTDKIIATRQLEGKEQVKTVSAFAAGVSGLTGIDSFEVVKGLKEQVNPDLIICVDALCAFRTDRIGRAYQISNTGIRAGGGAGKPSKYKIDEDSMGVPVISIGVPFVVSARKMLLDAAGGNTDFDPISPEEDMFVTPRDVDAILAESSEVIASALNSALNPNFNI